MPGQRCRRRIRRTLNALGIGMSLAVAGVSSFRVQAGQERFLAFTGLNTHHSRGYANGHRRVLGGFGALSPAAPLATMKPKRSSVSSARSSILEGSGFGYQSRLRARSLGVSPRREKVSHVSGRDDHGSVGPLRATSVLLHDEPVRLGSLRALPFATRARHST